MTFQEILERLVDGTPGALAGAIMAADGVPIEEYSKSGEELDLASVAIEFQHVLEQSKKISGTLYPDSGSALEELMLVTAGHQLYFRQIDDEFFCAVALSHEGLLGKARYLLRSLLQDLREAL